jgi:hypothetical protein
MSNNPQDWSAFPVSYGSALKSMEPTTKVFQAIGAETSCYAKKSIETTLAYFQKLSTVKSFDEAVKLQNEFASSSYQEFINESTRFGDLYQDYLKAVLPQRVEKTPDKKPDRAHSVSQNIDH